MPRSSVGPNGDPERREPDDVGVGGVHADAADLSGLLSPMNCQLFPASVDLKTPRPMITFERIAALPVPTQT